MRCLPSITRAGFYYSTSSDGLSWTLGDLAFPGVGAWYSSVICPDVHYGAQQGEMYLYFQGGANGIGRADSYDGGLTFIDHGAPVLTSDDPDSIIVRTPSVARLQDTYYMVYSEVCAGTGPPFVMATLNLAVSMDGFDWTPSPHNPIPIAGECDQFDRGAVALGQLVVDPDGETLHLFYSGAGWMMYNGQPSTRGCAKVGHAVSTDLGRTWCKTGSPVLDHPPAGLDAWDTKQYMVTSYTWEHDLDGNDVLRMYYWGEYPAGPSCVGALGIAEATDLPRCAATSVAENADGASNIPYRHRVSLASHPNPTAGRTRIFHGLIPGGEQGAATLTIYNVRGQRIRRLWSGDLGSAPARFEWDGRSDAGLDAASGRYLLRLDSEGSTVGAHWITVLR